MDGFGFALGYNMNSYCTGTVVAKQHQKYTIQSMNSDPDN